MGRNTQTSTWHALNLLTCVLDDDVVIFAVVGCTLVSSQGLCGLTQLRNLDELELTNCPSATKEVYLYLRENMTTCLVLD